MPLCGSHLNHLRAAPPRHRRALPETARPRRTASYLTGRHPPRRHRMRPSRQEPRPGADNRPTTPICTTDRPPFPHNRWLSISPTSDNPPAGSSLTELVPIPTRRAPPPAFPGSSPASPPALPPRPRGSPPSHRLPAQPRPASPTKPSSPHPLPGGAIGSSLSSRL